MNETKNPTGAGPQGAYKSSTETRAANISAGTSVGNAGQPATPHDAKPQGLTLASHSSKPLGGGAGATGAGVRAGQPSSTQAAGPERNLHQDKDAGMGLGSQNRGLQGGGTPRQGETSTADTVRQAAGQAQDTLRNAAGQAQEVAGELYEQASERAGEVYEQATEWARDKYDQASHWASDQYGRGSRYAGDARRSSMQGVGSATGSVTRFVRENPVLVGVIGLAAGLLLGALLPRTRREDETFGRWSDDLRDQSMRYARDMTQRGREFVDEAFTDGDDRFATHESEWRQRRDRSGPAGRFQNH